MDLFTPTLIGIGTGFRTSVVRIGVIIALSFGVFQAGMTVIGWLAGTSVITLISGYDHWIAFTLLLIRGITMTREGFQGDGYESRIQAIGLIPVIILSVSTSIDALAVGVSFGLLRTTVLLPALIISVVCGCISFSRVILGGRLESVLGRKAEILGGFILVLIGIKILIDHTLG